MTEKKEKYEAQEITADDARRILEAEKRQGLERCKMRIAQVLQEEGYTLEGALRPAQDADGGWRIFVEVRLKEV